MKGFKTLLITIPIAIILFGFVIYQYGYQEIQKRISSIKEEQDVKINILKKYIALMSEIPFLEKRLVSLKEILESYNEELMEGETEAIVSASLQETVRNIITNKGGKVTHERIGQGIETGRFKVISVGIEASMPDVKALSEALYVIETYTPYLLIKDIDVSIKDYGNPRELRVKLEISALTGGIQGEGS